MSRLPILVVDDKEFIRAYMVKFLKKNHYSVIGASNANDAMAYLKKDSFALIITDVLMPETDGFELVDYIRDYHEPVKSTPIIAISGGGRTIDANAVLSALIEKVDLIMRKPFSKNDLLDNIEMLLSR